MELVTIEKKVVDFWKEIFKKNHNHNIACGMSRISQECFILNFNNRLFTNFESVDILQRIYFEFYFEILSRQEKDKRLDDIFVSFERNDKIFQIQI